MGRSIGILYPGKHRSANRSFPETITYFAWPVMELFSSNIKQFFSKPIISVTVVLLALSARMFLQVHFFVTDDDKTYQIQAAQNFLDGHGFTIRQVLSTDLSQPYFIHLVKWPPGYSFLLLPFLILCGNDFFVAALLLDLVFAFAFIFIARKLLVQLSLPLYLINIYTLVSGFFIYDFFAASTSDFITLVLYMGALSITLAILKSPVHGRWMTILLLALLLFFTGFTRYMFIPVAFVIPAYLAVSGWISNNRILASRGIVLFLLIGAFTTTFLLLQQHFAGAATYVAPTQKGFFPEHLLRFFPHIISGFINVNFVCTQLEKWSGISFLTWAVMLMWLNYLLFIPLLFLFSRWLYKKKWRIKSLYDHYICIGTISSVAIIAVLLVLSLSNEAVKTHVLYDWSFVQEGRYFAFPVFFVQQALFVFFVFSYPSLHRWGKKIVLCFFLLLGIGISHGVYYTIKKALNSRQTIFDRPKNMALISYSKQLLEQTMLEHAGKNIVIVSQQPFFNNYAALWYGIPGLYETGFFYTNNIQSKKETVLFLVEKQVLPTDDTDRVTKRKKIGQIDDNHFYLIDVYPATR